MVRTIDQEARRREIVDAVWRILERGGLEDASVRKVAAEAGLATGSVRHFFGTQAELHAFALRSLSERVGERVRRAAAEPDVRTRVVAMLTELMPLRDDTTRELRIWLEFVHRSRFDENLAAIVAEQAAEVRRFLTHVVTGLGELGHLCPTADHDEVAAGLNAFVDGLTFELLTAPALLTRERAFALLESFVFGHHMRNAAE
ncbi:TetR/AcrR family transcriptional regulator [Prauserella cavernicola]|uniref:TetR family transcriptional regulator C-terminal domain-containing protein n=1 Tax=Prauserella cavernicola TaxID=2800127 RepID=A0A934QWF7_9PSEU|nr:TetR family transcriptional regulator C-terminal domain-containing protein [Prauserella cavernicola]MBK1787683.1 TetR family transcriptional regulator C-terminal domain-containing protein [Prauserella cavernicola]